jgi:hypothetical protein
VVVAQHIEKHLAQQAVIIAQQLRVKNKQRSKLFKCLNMEITLEVCRNQIEAKEQRQNEFRSITADRNQQH